MKGNLLEKYTIARPEEAAKPDEQEGTPDDLGAFGYLRGVRDRALMLEIRFKDGRRRALGYAWLHDVEFDPSAGMTLHFGGRKVKITGRNLNRELKPSICLFDAIVRHRVPWVQEAAAPAAMQAAREDLVVDRIEISA
jgi:hypothetical protein